MIGQQPEEFLLQGAQARLERAYINQYLERLGYSQESLLTLPEAQVRQIMSAASLFASIKLTEVEAKAHLADEMHGGQPAL